MLFYKVEEKKTLAVKPHVKQLFLPGKLWVLAISDVFISSKKIPMSSSCGFVFFNLNLSFHFFRQHFLAPQYFTLAGMLGL